MKDSTDRLIPKPGDDLVAPVMKSFTGSIVMEGKETKFVNGKNVTDQDPVALVGILAAKLACYKPDDTAVQWALNWLEERK